MKLTDLFLADLEREVPATRRVLERVPDGSYDWKPHPKSMPMGYLSTLVATMPAWIDTMVTRRARLRPEGRPEYKAPELRTSRGPAPGARRVGRQGARRALPARPTRTS